MHKRGFGPWWAAVVAMVASTAAHADPLTAADRAELAAGRAVVAIVEFDSAAVERAANAEKARRGRVRDDATVLAMRAQGYAAIKRNVEAALSGTDAQRTRDFQHLPLAVWRLSSLSALDRLSASRAVRAVHHNPMLRAISVSDLPFINQPQAAAEGAAGAGTTVAVIDGGLADNYKAFSDFGTCTDIATPAATCRVVYNKHYGAGTSTETVHGTNVSAIALGVAPGAKLAMFDVFNDDMASGTDILTAVNDAIDLQSTYNIVAISMSLGDGGSYTAAQCAGSPLDTPFQMARDDGILPVVAAGNSGSKLGLGFPACVAGAVSVGAVYDNSYGTVPWGVPTTCTDPTSAPDRVTCFSQSASYLTLLAPGTFVNAPNSSFQQSGTSQATPHISGAVAVLRARYPAESIDQTVKRMQDTGIKDMDSGNGVIVPRLNLLAAVNEGTALGLSGTGPTQATMGGSGTYTLKITNSGPLTATNIRLVDHLPPQASPKSLPAGCTFATGTVTCIVSSLAAGSAVTFSIVVNWTGTGPAADFASVTADQTDTVNSSVVFGDPATTQTTDAPLPAWAWALLALTLVYVGRRQLGSA